MYFKEIIPGYSLYNINDVFRTPTFNYCLYNLAQVIALMIIWHHQNMAGGRWAEWYGCRKGAGLAARNVTKLRAGHNWWLTTTPVQVPVPVPRTVINNRLRTVRYIAAMIAAAW